MNPLYRWASFFKTFGTMDARKNLTLLNECSPNTAFPQWGVTLPPFYFSATLPSGISLMPTPQFCRRSSSGPRNPWMPQVHPHSWCFSSILVCLFLGKAELRYSSSDKLCPEKPPLWQPWCSLRAKWALCPSFRLCWSLLMVMFHTKPSRAPDLNWWEQGGGRKWGNELKFPLDPLSFSVLSTHKAAELFLDGNKSVCCQLGLERPPCPIGQRPLLKHSPGDHRSLQGALSYISFLFSFFSFFFFFGHATGLAKPYFSDQG